MSVEDSLKFEFRDVSHIDNDLAQSIDGLDHLAFKDSQPVQKNAPSKWSNPTWMIIGFVNNGTPDEQLVCQLGLLKRNIRVGDMMLEVVGVGGVATHPDWQRKGYAKQLLAFTENVLRQDLKCDFALLLCDGIPCLIYRKAGWIDVAKVIIYREDDVRIPLETNVMVFETSDRTFPEGEIDVCGLPW